MLQPALFSFHWSQTMTNKKQRLIRESNTFHFTTYSRFPLVLVRGKGCRVWDSEGNRYLDFFSGLAVDNLGHCHPRLVRAIHTQAKRLIHVSNLFHTVPQIELARELVRRSFADRAFFCNSGAEANEGAIKLARKYSQDKWGPGRYEIIAMNNSFHGRTLATLTATGQKKYQRGFEPLVPGFRHVPFDDLNALRRAISKKTCAVMVEPIQGEGGVCIPSRGYLKGLRSLCTKKRLLLIFDEVQTGMGRTGRLFAYEHEGVEPDILTMAKALAGGVPMGAMLAREEVARSFTPGTHASTFGGNPLACSAALMTLKILKEDGLISNAARVGSYFLSRLREIKERFPFIRDVRGRGLMLALELTFEGKDVVKQCIERRLLINCTAGTVIRFLPPLIITRKEVDEALSILKGVLKEI